MHTSLEFAVLAPRGAPLASPSWCISVGGGQTNASRSSAGSGAFRRTTALDGVLDAFADLVERARRRAADGCPSRGAERRRPARDGRQRALEAAGRPLLLLVQRRRGKPGARQ